MLTKEQVKAIREEYMLEGPVSSWSENEKRQAVCEVAKLCYLEDYGFDPKDSECQYWQANVSSFPAKLLDDFFWDDTICDGRHVYGYLTDVFGALYDLGVFDKEAKERGMELFTEDFVNEDVVVLVVEDPTYSVYFVDANDLPSMRVDVLDWFGITDEDISTIDNCRQLHNHQIPMRVFYKWLNCKSLTHNRFENAIVLLRLLMEDSLTATNGRNEVIERDIIDVAVNMADCIIDSRKERYYEG